MNTKFSSEYKNILEYSRTEAIKFNSAQIEPIHLFLSLLNDPSYKIVQLLSSISAHDIILLRDKINSEYSSKEQQIIITEEVVASPLCEQLIKLSIQEAQLLNNEIVNIEHLLLALFHNSETVNMKFMKPFLDSDINYNNIYLHLKNTTETPVFGTGFTDDEEFNDEDDIMSHNENSDIAQSHLAKKTSSSKKGNDTPVLDKYGIDITRAAEENKLDPVIGRDIEIERIAQILSRRKKNNPVLIGEPGVGKSAIVEGLALRIIQRKVSRVLFNKRLIALDMATIVAGTKYRGQFEERINAIISELSKNKDIILFIDELHTIIGAGNAQGSMDAANILKPALARGEVQCIGATTLDEYRKSIEKDGALERRFQKVLVEPTSAEETVQILNNIKDKYEDHHNVSFTPAAIEACVNLTQRYISDRNFPDKAIDALDEAGSRVHITNISVPKEIENLELEINEISQLKLKAAQSQDFEGAASYRDKEHKLREHLEKEKIIWEEKLNNSREIVDEEKIAEVIAMMTGVPVQRIAQTEGKRLLEMASSLKAQIIGQNNAIDKISKAIQRNRIGLKDPNKPIGTFMFLGPTGVGKTLLAKKLAEFLFDTTDAIIRIDMSEFMEKFTVSRLVGAPPGYVGYEEGGQLTEKVRRHPYSIVLLDEIEKAHPDVFNILLQVMDEGQLTDSYGRKVDFKNTLIIMTSNIGSRQLKDFGTGIGFNTKTIDTEHSQSIIQKALNKTFSPEFLNRIDDIITFESLSKEAIHKIIDIELSGLFNRINKLGYLINITDEAKTYIANKGYDPQYGARPLKRAIQTYIEDKLAELIINGTIPTNCNLTIDFDNDKNDIKIDLK